MSLVKFKTIWCRKLISAFVKFTIESINLVTLDSYSLFTYSNSLKDRIIARYSFIFFISDYVGISLRIKNLLSCIRTISGKYFHIFNQIPNDKAIKTWRLSNSDRNLVLFRTSSDQLNPRIFVSFVNIQRNNSELLAGLIWHSFEFVVPNIKVIPEKNIIFVHCEIASCKIVKYWLMLC